MLAALWLAVPACRALEVTGSDGRTVTVDAPVERIITLAPHLTELVFAAGAGDKLVGVGRYSDYPKAAQSIPRVGDAYRIDLERVVALEPDLILAWESGNPPAAIESMRELGLTVLVTETQSVAGIARLLRRIGRLAGTEAVANAAADAFLEGFAELRRRYSDRPPVRVFYQVSAQPLFTLGGSHFVSEVIEICGGVNVFAGLGTLAPRVSEEAVIARDPQVIVAGVSPEQDNALARWRRWENMAAVAFDNLYTLPADLMHRATPRLLKGARRLCHVLETARRHIRAHRPDGEAVNAPASKPASEP